MQIEGTRELDASREAVYRAMTDPELISDALPGVGRVKVEKPDHWQAEIKVPLPRAPRLAFDFRLVEQVPPEHARLTAYGKTFGGGMTLDTSFDLTEAEGKTAMAWRAEVRLTGLLGRLGDGLVTPVARQMVEGLLKAVERRVAK